MKIYTKTGDKGETSLFGGTRVPKHHIRIESYGTVDELNSFIGLIKDQEIDETSKKTLLNIQNQLFTIGAMLATAPEKKFLKSGKSRLNIETSTSKSIFELENEIDAMNETLPELTSFVLPGGHTVVSYCHIARCVCRRAERICSLLAEKSPVDNDILVYLNRLSDFLFVLARKLTYTFKAQEIPWIPEKK